MALVDYYYFAPLANARGHFRSLNFPEPFKVERWSHAKIVRLWRQLAWLPKLEIELQSEDRQVVPRTYETGHVIVGAIKRPDLNQGANWLRCHEELDELERPLRDHLRLIGLFLGGQVAPAGSYWYMVESGKPLLMHGGMTMSPLRDFPVTPNQNNIRGTNEFISSNKLPLTPDYIQTALEHWEEAYRSTQPHIEFFSLMVALETLFNVGAQDIRYRVSRSIAVLLGDTPEDADHIFESVKHAYDVRSKLVHTGRAKGLEKVWIWHLRRLVQEAILHLKDLNMSKEEVSNRLNRLGFGQGSEVAATPQALQKLRDKALPRR